MSNVNGSFTLSLLVQKIFDLTARNAIYAPPYMRVAHQNEIIEKLIEPADKSLDILPDGYIIIVGDVNRSGIYLTSSKM